MAEFDIAYKKVIEGHEAGYVNDPDDTGGETWDGISRVHNPDWPGWEIIDAMKKNPEFPKCLGRDQQLQQLKKALYRNVYWSPWLTDMRHQEIADKVFDLRVNLGVTNGTKLFQKAINLTNKNEELYNDINVDGNLGMETFHGYVYAFQNGMTKILLNVINGYQFKWYIELMEKKPVYEKYIGWFKRVKISW